MKKTTVQVDRDLEDLIPGFLENRRQDVVKLKAATAHGEWETVRIIGHTLKGIGGGYGFDRITELGQLLERAAKGENSQEALTVVSEFETYIDSVEIMFL